MPNAQNLKPFKPGESGNPNGRPKGSKSLATIIRELENEDFDWSKVPIKNQEAAKTMGSPFKAIVLVALGQAMGGDRHAREWLRKAGYGDKLDITSNDQPIQAATVVDLGNLHNATDKPKAEPDSPSDKKPQS